MKYDEIINNYDGFIFDLDGVLIDTAKYHFLSWKNIVEQYNLPINFTIETNELLKGVSRRRCLEILLDLAGIKYSTEKFEQVLIYKNEIYLNYINKLSPSDVNQNVIKFLEKLKQANKKLSIASASKNAVFILEKINLIKYFDSIIDGTKVSKAKPDPQVFKLAADSINCNYEKCIVFEDSISGIEGALSLNMYTIGIGDKNNLCKADIVVNGFQDLLN